MTTSFKVDEIVDLMEQSEPLLPGNFACSGCGMTIAMRVAISAIKNPIVVIPACCASVVESLHPNISYNFPVVNIAFAAHAATASGIARAKKMRGEDVTTVVWSGDGGSFDIGMATLSGAAERGENIIHTVYDNGFYGNTGAQRSSATPRGAGTTTTPQGKEQKRKSIGRIMMNHDIAYCATTSVGYPRDIFAKFHKASQIDGFKFILIDAPCPTGWISDPDITVELGKKSVKTGFFPMWEYENSKLTFTSPSNRLKDPSKRAPLEDYLKHQGRFKNLLTRPEVLEALKQDIAYEWAMLERFE
ncbi:MAG: thiamine pyrophosphate-dependent enzyme [Candidatus Hodarchaeales archaeon]|jgi:pyruvate ferredoxin oxidoreductase beta subunit